MKISYGITVYNEYKELDNLLFHLSKYIREEDEVVVTQDVSKVGTGVLSKIVTFADKLFANIAGESKEKTNLVQLLSINTKVETYRKSWREKY